MAKTRKTHKKTGPSPNEAVLDFVLSHARGSDFKAVTQALQSSLVSVFKDDENHEKMSKVLSAIHYAWERSVEELAYRSTQKSDKDISDERRLRPELMRSSELCALLLKKKDITPFSVYETEEGSPLWLDVALKKQWWGLLGAWIKSNDLSSEVFAQHFSRHDHLSLLMHPHKTYDDDILPSFLFPSEFSITNTLQSYRKKNLWLVSRSKVNEQGTILNSSDYDLYQRMIRHRPGIFVPFFDVLTAGSKYAPCHALVRRMPIEKIQEEIQKDVRNFWIFSHAWEAATTSENALSLWQEKVLTGLSVDTLKDIDKVLREDTKLTPAAGSRAFIVLGKQSLGKQMLLLAEKSSSLDDVLWAAHMMASDIPKASQEDFSVFNRTDWKAFSPFMALESENRLEKSDKTKAFFFAMVHASRSWDEKNWAENLPLCASFLRQEVSSPLAHHFISPLQVFLQRSTFGEQCLPFATQAFWHALCALPEKNQEKIIQHIERGLPFVDKNPCIRRIMKLPLWDLLESDLPKLKGTERGHVLATKMSLTLMAAQNEHRPSAPRAKM